MYLFTYQIFMVYHVPDIFPSGNTTRNRTKSVFLFSGYCFIVVDNHMSDEVRKVVKEKVHKVRG